MTPLTQFVGIDSHQDTVTFAVLPDGASVCDDPLTLDNDPSKIRTFVAKVAKRGQYPDLPLGVDTQVVENPLPSSGGIHVQEDSQGHRDPHPLAVGFRLATLGSSRRRGGAARPPRAPDLRRRYLQFTGPTRSS